MSNYNIGSITLLKAEYRISKDNIRKQSGVKLQKSFKMDVISFSVIILTNGSQISL